MTRIECKVGSILNEREVVLTAGETHGVQVGMQFDILYPGGIAVRNPDDPDEILGSVEWAKTQVKVIKVYPQLAVARTFRTVTIPASGSLGFGAIAAGLSYKPEQTTVETLRTDGTFAAKEIDARDSVVKVGDPAVQSSGPTH